MQVTRKVWDTIIRDKGYGTDQPYLTGQVVTIGIDPGISNTGIAILYSGLSIPILHSTFMVKTDSFTPAGQRLAEIYSAVKKACDDAHSLSKQIYWEGTSGNQGFPSILASIERYISSRGSSKALTPLVIGVAQMQLYQSGIDAAGLYPTQIKKAVSGNGKATKGEIRTAVLDQVEIPLKEDVNARRITNHEMDAIGIALCAMWGIK